MSGARPVHQALVDAACAATAADQGWLLAAHEDHLTVLAAAGGPDPGSLIGANVAITGARGYAVSSGQPAALRPSSNDQSNAGAGGGAGIPGALLATPCGDEDIVGVLEIVRSAGGESFSFDDVEIVSLLADIAGAAIGDVEDDLLQVTPPERLGAELTTLAGADPRRYADIARVIDALLGQA